MTVPCMIQILPAPSACPISPRSPSTVQTPCYFHFHGPCCCLFHNVLFKFLLRLTTPVSWVRCLLQCHFREALLGHPSNVSPQPCLSNALSHLPCGLQLLCLFTLRHLLFFLFCLIECKLYGRSPALKTHHFVHFR